MNLLPCAPGPGCADNTSYDTINTAVRDANQVFKSVGVQFWVRSIERYLAPTFVDPDADDQIAWSTALSELGAAFPAMQVDAWAPPVATKKRFEWLRAIAAVYAPNHEITIWLCTTGHDTRFPEMGRDIRMGNFSTQPYKLAHELGHYFGLRHTWEDERGGAVDPQTLQPKTMSDRWDLVYKPGTGAGNPHKFYNNKSAAAADEASLKLIEPRPCKYHCPAPATTDCAGACKAQPLPCGTSVADCTDKCKSCTCPAGTPNWCACACGTGECDSVIDGNPPGTLTLHVADNTSYIETYTNGDAQAKGLAANLGTQKAINVLTYRGDWTTHPYFISESQALEVRKYLRWDVPISQSLSVITQNRNTAYAYSPSGRRPLLGSWSVRDPLLKLDFNGDGKRDIAVWIPPSSPTAAGRLKVLLSPSFSQSPGAMIDTDFGRLGDLPVPMDYDGDGRTDFGVFQPGGGADRSDPTNVNAYWRWCITSSTPASTNCSGISQTTCPSGNCLQYGWRSDVPTPGLEFDGTLPNEFSVYRPTSGAWFWRNSSGTINTVRAIGNANTGSIPLPALYDSDDLSDIVLYEPDNSTFYYRRSQQGWNTAGSRTMGAFSPDPTDGSAQDRSGALPMPMYHEVFFCNPCLYRALRSFSVFFPYDGTWNTVWDPFGTNTLDPPCQYGNGPLDQPFSGFNKDTYPETYSDMGIFRDDTYGGGATIYTRSSVSGACNGSNLNVACANCGVRSRVFAVYNMTSDGKEEIIVIHPDTMTMEWRASESNYAYSASNQWVVGDPTAEFL